MGSSVQNLGPLHLPKQERTVQLQLALHFSLFSNCSAVLSPRPRPLSLLPSGCPQEWRHMHLQPGNLIQVEGVGKAALRAFV